MAVQQLQLLFPSSLAHAEKSTSLLSCGGFVGRGKGEERKMVRQRTHTSTSKPGIQSKRNMKFPKGKSYVRFSETPESGRLLPVTYYDNRSTRGNNRRTTKKKKTRPLATDRQSIG